MNIYKPHEEFSKPFHTSGYAEVANSGAIGSTNTQTFGQRYRIDRNRRAVRRYSDSYVGHGTPQGYARTTTARQEGNAPRLSPKLASRSSTSPPSRPTFIEPPGRGFNPYA